MKYVRFFVFAFAVSLIAVALVGSRLAAAASVNWTGAGGDRLASNPQNWANAAAPVSGTDLVFPSGATVVWDLPGIVPSSVSSGASLTLSAPLIISGGLKLEGGKLATSSYPLNVGGDFSMTGGELAAEGSPVNVSGNWHYSSGTLSLGAAAVTFNGSAEKTIFSGGQAFGSLSVASIGRVSLSDDLIVNGTLATTSGVLSANGKTVTVSGGVVVNGGTFDIAGSKLILAGTGGRPLSVSGGSLLMGSGASVEYRSSGGSSAIEPAAYAKLALTGTNVYGLGGDVSVSGELSIASGATLSLSGHALTVSGGGLRNEGAITEGAIRCSARSLRLIGADGSALSSIASASSAVYAEVSDDDLNRKGLVAEVVPAVITVTTLGGDREIFSVTETGPATAVFRSSSVVVHQGEVKAMNGQVEAGQNDIIFVSYADPQDPSDVKTSQLTVSVGSLAASGAPQIVSGPRITGWSSISTGSATTYSAHIVWQTDRASSSSVAVTSAQLTAPIAAGSLDGTTEHDVIVTGLVQGRIYSFTVTSVTPDGKTVTSSAKKFTVIVSGDRIKTAASPAVYWYLEGKRAVFADFTSYDSWFSGWNGVVTVPAEQLADIPIGKMVPIRAGTYLIKIQSDPKTYAVEPYGRLRWIQTEEKAKALFGDMWSGRVRDVDVSQFVGYALGAPLGPAHVPSGFVYRIAGGEWNAVIGSVSRQFSDSGRRLNAFPERFVSTVAPAAVDSLSGAGPILGYEQVLRGVFMDGTKAVDAPYMP